MPCRHSLEEYLDARLDGAGIAGDAKGPLFKTIDRGTAVLTRTPLLRATPAPWWAGGPLWPGSARSSATTAPE